MLWGFECNNPYLWVRGVCFDTDAQMCSCISSSEVYDPDPRLSGGGQEQFLCVVVFNRLEKQITLTVTKSRCSRKVTLYTHEIPTCYLSKAALAFKMLLKDSRHANSYCYCYMLTKSLTEASCISFLPVTLFLQTNQTHKKRTKTGFITILF